MTGVLLALRGWGRDAAPHPGAQVAPRVPWPRRRQGRGTQPVAASSPRGRHGARPSRLLPQRTLAAPQGGGSAISPV